MRLIQSVAGDADSMAMRCDDAGNYAAALELGDPGFVTNQPVNFAICADGQNPPVTNRHCRDNSIRGVHR